LAVLLFAWLVDLLGRHLLARLVAQLEDWLVGWLVVQLVGSLVAWLMGGTASIAQAFLCLWLAWQIYCKLLFLFKTLLILSSAAYLGVWFRCFLVESANYGVQLASQIINIRTR